jgi:hypothetical protein
MRAFQTSVLERKEAVERTLATEPFEAGWAGEAIFFVEAHGVAGGSLLARVQISPDGIRWIDEGAARATLDGPGRAYIRVAHFGGWLRLVVDAPPGDGGTTQVTIHLALKE